MRTYALTLTLVASVNLFLSCGAVERGPLTQQPTPTPAASPSTEDRWAASFAEILNHLPEVKRAWTDFERSQNYRLARPSDRNLTSQAAARVSSNNPNQIKPFLNWWGARGYEGKTDFLVAIVVDPSRTDSKRYGLVVFAAPKSEGPDFRPYWVLREEDMESYLISAASGNVSIECFRRDGTEETKRLVWDQSSRKFRLA